jgi:hypothetical protein
MESTNSFANSMTVKLRISASFLAVVLTGAVWFQRQTLHETRAERTRLQTPTAARETASPVDSDEIDHLRQSTRQLPKLRNEVRQLRAQTNGIEILRTEQQRMLARLASITNAPPRPPPTAEQGFVMSDTWANAGLATPESAIQTFFWALRARNLEALAACLHPDHARNNGLLHETTGEWNREALQEFLIMGNAPAFRIVKVESNSEDRIHAHIQAAVNGAIVTFDLAREGREWKFTP